MAVLFEEFLAAVPEQQQPFVSALHKRLCELGCKLTVQEAKRGFTVSYKWSGKTVMNWVFRKSGLVARIYGDHAAQYEPVLNGLPASLKQIIAASPDCKRLIDPTACSGTCVMGVRCTVDGAALKKCRYNCMLFPLGPASGPFIQALAEAEATARGAAD